jgi:dTDP-4-dehydrorhamnose reductase
MTILLLGKNGQLGWELQRCLAPMGPLVALDFEDLNLEDFDAVRAAVRSLRPEVIVNASAYTAVDQAESEPDKAFAINATIPGILAEEARGLDAKLIHYSTDYVFDGCKGSVYTEADATNPLSVYGKSKLAGEQNIGAVSCSHLILRTSWVYSLRRGSFVTKTLEWARRQEIMRVVDDQIGNPTWARILAETTALLLARGSGQIDEHSGVYHLAGSGFASRLDWSKQILELDPNRQEQVVKKILPARTSDFPTPATRPLFSALDCELFERTFGLRMPDWQKALQLAMG